LKFEGSWNYDTTNKLITYVILPLLLLTVLPGESGLGSLVKKSKLFILQQCSASYACTWELAKQSRIAQSDSSFYVECPEKFKIFEQSGGVANVYAAMFACAGPRSKGTSAKSSFG